MGLVGGVTCCPRLARFPGPFEVTQESPRVPLAPTTTYLSRAPPSRDPTPSPAPGLAPRQPRVQPPERANIFPLLLFPLECLERAGFHLSITEKKRRSLKKKKVASSSCLCPCRTLSRRLLCTLVLREDRDLLPPLPTLASLPLRFVGTFHFRYRKTFPFWVASVLGTCLSPSAFCCF